MRIEQAATLIISLLVIVLDILWMFKNKKIFLVAIPELLYFCHLIIFYISIYLGLFGGYYSSWSSNLRLHGIITFLILILYRVVKKGGQTWLKTTLHR